VLKNAALKGWQVRFLLLSHPIDHRQLRSPVLKPHDERQRFGYRHVCKT
jgi:hypothetical protein